MALSRDTNLKETRSFKGLTDRKQLIHEILKEVYAALQTKGYDPVSQIVGYIMSGDPTYITSEKNARSLIRQIERDELLEELVKEYIGVNEWKKE